MAFSTFRISKPPQRKANEFHNDSDHVQETTTKQQRDEKELNDLTLAHPSLQYLRPSNPTPLHPPNKYHLTPGLSTYLTTLTRTLLDLLVNQHDLEHPLLLKHLSPFFVAVTNATNGNPTNPSASCSSSSSSSSSPSSCSSSDERGKHVARWQDIPATLPDVRVDVIDCVAQIHEDGRKANVWTFKRMTGFYDGGICKEAVSVMMWERAKGQVWMCVKFKKLQGVSEFY